MYQYKVNESGELSSLITDASLISLHIKSHNLFVTYILRSVSEIIPILEVCISQIPNVAGTYSQENINPERETNLMRHNYIVTAIIDMPL